MWRRTAPVARCRGLERGRSRRSERLHFGMARRVDRGDGVRTRDRPRRGGQRRRMREVLRLRELDCDCVGDRSPLRRRVGAGREGGAFEVVEVVFASVSSLASKGEARFTSMSFLESSSAKTVSGSRRGRVAIGARQCCGGDVKADRLWERPNGDDLKLRRDAQRRQCVHSALIGDVEVLRAWIDMRLCLWV